MKGWLITIGTIGLVVLGIGAWRRSQVIERAPGVLVPEFPEQEPTSKEPFWIGEDRVVPLKKFKLRARVLHRMNYDNDPMAKFCPTDLALGWGLMSDTKVLSQFRISQDVRHSFIYWEQEISLSRETLTRCNTNMHVIPANPLVEVRLDEVKVGHIVNIKGQLVKVLAKDGRSYVSSTSRMDSGGGACEIVWVESLEIEE